MEIELIDIVRNFITVFGSEEVRSLVPEICRRLDLNPDIGDVLFGKSFSDADDCFKKTGAFVLTPSKDFGFWSDEITLVSGRKIPHQLIAHITWFLSKIDPNVVVCNKYDHEEGRFVGTTFRFVEKGKIRLFDEIVYIESTVMTDEELEECSTDGDAPDDVLTWEQLGEIHSKTTKTALDQLLSEFPKCVKYVNA